MNGITNGATFPTPVGLNRNVNHIDDLTPLTAEELWRLMPWQPIETVPANTPVFVIESGVFQRCSFEFNGEYWVISGIDEPMDDNFNPTEWLPLPKVDL